MAYKILRREAYPNRWSKRFPNPALDGNEAEIEVRQLDELEDFPHGEAGERFRKLEAEYGV
jgi:hypothetical protein